jgi:hypothetical protein
LPELGDDPASTLRLRRIGEQCLPRETAADDLGVDLRVPFPRPHHFQLVHPPFDAGRHDRMVHLLDSRQVGGIDLMKATAETG